MIIKQLLILIIHVYIFVYLKAKFTPYTLSYNTHLTWYIRYVRVYTHAYVYWPVPEWIILHKKFELKLYYYYMIITLHYYDGFGRL